MTRKFKLIGAALFALLLFVTPALALNAHAVQHPSHVLGWIGLVTLGIAGVTITYAESLNAPRNAAGAYPGGTTAPTAAQAAQLNSLVATVNMGDADTTATIIHNFTFNAAQLAALMPWISWYWSGTAGTGVLSFTPGTTNIVVLKGTGTGSGGTFVVIVQSPNSFIQ